MTFIMTPNPDQSLGLIECTGNNIGGNFMWTKCGSVSLGSGDFMLTKCGAQSRPQLCVWRSVTVDRGPWSTQAWLLPRTKSKQSNKQWLMDEFVNEWVPFWIWLAVSRLTRYGLLLRCTQSMSNKSTVWLPHFMSASGPWYRFPFFKGWRNLG